ncbi:MAG: response regulator transcription factor [Coriobacteriales bacterium]|jgi:two-component system response regulator RegX3|nr:response regulator transcription factor [Coriobacteriales bacterium]
MRYDCLIIDDEDVLSLSTQEYFELFGISTAWAASAEAALAFFAENTADLILLDINLGEESGFSLCQQLRQSYELPILFISARTSDDDVLLALGIGGDDYIPKPYSLSVLLAKVKAVLKRYRSTASRTYTFGRFVIDFELERVSSAGEDIGLKAMEYKLLAYLIQNRNRAITKDKIFREVWKDAITTENTLNVHIRRLREKIEDDPSQPLFIKTVWGTGYSFEGSEL